MFTKQIILCSLLIIQPCYTQVPPPTLYSGEYWTNLFSAAYDYQSSGSIRYIIQNPSDPSYLGAILMANIDSNTIPPGSINRYVYFSYSNDGGRTWSLATEVNNVYPQGFPCFSLTNTGNPVIALHETRVPTRTFVYQDVNFGAGAFIQVSNFPGAVSWPQITGTSNVNLVVCGTESLFGTYSYFNGTNWSPLIQLPESGGGSGQFSIESGPNGLVFIFGVKTESTPGYGNKLWLSTNNGVNFTLQTGSNAPPDYISSGNDTLVAYLDGGRQGIFVGNEIHLVYSVYATNSEALPSPPNTVWFKKAKIIHWSPSTGVDTVAGRYNMPNMTDTLTQALVTPLCQPSMGITNGVLLVSYTAYLRGNKQTVNDGSLVNAGEIVVSASFDSGSTWLIPVKITNTPAIEEKHSSVVRNIAIPTGDSLGVFYLRDLKAGNWVSVAAWGKAPVYGIYRKLYSLWPHGIKQDLELVKQYRLFQNYPNPFNPTTKISYYLEKEGFVNLKLYNVLGEEVAVLISGHQKKGAKEITFDGSDFPSGIYFYTLTAGDFIDTKAMVLVK